MRADFMGDLWDVEGNNLDLGYENLRAARHASECQLRHALDGMWEVYAPYADTGFKPAFARDPEARFWEMYLACRLLAGGKTLLRSMDRQRNGKWPDICVLDGQRRIWIEAIAPTSGAVGPDQVRGPRPINDGGGFEAAPVRQAQLRITSALRTKSLAIDQYVQAGIIGPEDGRLIAIGVGRFGIYVPELVLPLVMSAIFPLGDEFVTIDLETGDLVDQGFRFSAEIARAGPSVARTAFVDERHAHVSGLLFSRMSIGSLGHQERPLSLVHNPLATQGIVQQWGVWDHEYVTTRRGERWIVTDVLASDAADASPP